MTTVHQRCPYNADMCINIVVALEMCPVMAQVDSFGMHACSGERHVFSGTLRGPWNHIIRGGIFLTRHNLFKIINTEYDCHFMAKKYIIFVSKWIHIECILRLVLLWKGCIFVKKKNPSKRGLFSEQAY